MTLRCPECRTRRKSFDLFTRHIRESGHRNCTCGGYWYPHRPLSPCCEKNPMADVHIARRHGGFTADDLWEIAVDCALEKKGRPLMHWPD